MTDAKAAYVSFLEQYASALENMCDQTQQRYNALVSFDAGQMTHAMSSLQSSIMQIDQLEAKRMALADEAGHKDLTFAETLRQAADEERAALEPLFERIRLAASNIKFMNEKSMQFAKDGLSALTPAALGETKNLYEPPARGRQKGVQASAVFDMEY